MLPFSRIVVFPMYTQGVGELVPLEYGRCGLVRRRPFSPTMRFGVEAIRSRRGRHLACRTDSMTELYRALFSRVEPKRTAEEERVDRSLSRRTSEWGSSLRESSA